MPRRLLFFFLAIMISGGTALLAQRWLHSRDAARPAEAQVIAKPQVRVLVAKTTLSEGSFLRAESVRWQDWPQDGQTETYFVEGKSKIEDFAGAVVRSRVTAGEPITADRVVRPGDRGFMAAVLTPGNRAVTINVSPNTGMAGFVFPGDHVDLILSMVLHSTDKDAQPRHMSETVLTDIRVVGMDQRYSDEKDKKDISIPKTATLEVTPKQAETVAVISELGLLSLSLRSLADNDEAGAPARFTRTFDSDAIHFPLAEQSAGKTRKIDVVRGSDASEVIVQATAPRGASSP